MKHTYQTCGGGDNCKCRSFICEGGLGFCTVCKGTEGSLTTECPGEPMDKIVQDMVYKGQIDYRDGQWVNR
jgi:hypothetical protein